TGDARTHIYRPSLHAALPISRLFIYHTEAQEKDPAKREALSEQAKIMMSRLWRGITIPSAILTLIFGALTLYHFGYWNNMPKWLDRKSTRLKSRHVKISYAII